MDSGFDLSGGLELVDDAVIQLPSVPGAALLSHGLGHPHFRCPDLGTDAARMVDDEGINTGTKQWTTRRHLRCALSPALTVPQSLLDP